MRTRRTKGTTRLQARRIALDFGIGFVLFVCFSALVAGEFERAPLSGVLTGEWARNAGVIGTVAADVVTVSLAMEPHADAAGTVKSLLPVPSTSGNPFLTGLSAPVAMAMLAAVFSALFAFNLAFFRHLARRATCRHPALR